MLPKWKLHKCSTTDECINLEVDTHTEWEKKRSWRFLPQCRVMLKTLLQGKEVPNILHVMGFHL